MAVTSQSATEPVQKTETDSRVPISSAPATSGTQPPEAGRRPNIEHLLKLPVPVVVQLASRNMPIESILSFTVGSIIEFATRFDSDLVLQVANRTIGHGKAVKVGEHFGLRITRIDTIPDRIDAMRG